MSLCKTALGLCPLQPRVCVCVYLGWTWRACWKWTLQGMYCGSNLSSISTQLSTTLKVANPPLPLLSHDLRQAPPTCQKRTRSFLLNADHTKSQYFPHCQSDSPVDCQPDFLLCECNTYPNSICLALVAENNRRLIGKQCNQ